MKPRINVTGLHIFDKKNKRISNITANILGRFCDWSWGWTLAIYQQK